MNTEAYRSWINNRWKVNEDGVFTVMRDIICSWFWKEFSSGIKLRKNAVFTAVFVLRISHVLDKNIAMINGVARDSRVNINTEGVCRFTTFTWICTKGNDF